MRVDETNATDRLTCVFKDLSLRERRDAQECGRGPVDHDPVIVDRLLNRRSRAGRIICPPNSIGFAVDVQPNLNLGSVAQCVRKATIDFFADGAKLATVNLLIKGEAHRFKNQ